MVEDGGKVGGIDEGPDVEIDLDVVLHEAGGLGSGWARASSQVRSLACLRLLPHKTPVEHWRDLTMTDAAPPPLSALGICLEEYDYPYPVGFLPLSNDLQPLKMAYMDIPRKRTQREDGSSFPRGGVGLLLLPHSVESSVSVLNAGAVKSDSSPYSHGPVRPTLERESDPPMITFRMCCRPTLRVRPISRSRFLVSCQNTRS